MIRNLLIIGFLTVLVGCRTKQQPVTETTQPPDSVIVRIPTPVDPAEVIPDPVSDTVTVLDSVTDTPRPVPVFVLLDEFSGTVQGFESKTYSFRLSRAREVSIQLADAQTPVVFKLYQKTGDLDETVTKEEMKKWQDELEAGAYEVKVFLPLKRAATKKKETYRLLVKAKE